MEEKKEIISVLDALQEIVLRQYAEIKAAHDRIRDLRDAVKMS